MSIKLFVNQSCGFCKQTEDFLNKRKIRFEKIDVTTDEGKKALNNLGFDEVPILLINDTIIKGYSPKRLNEAFTLPSIG